jgi:alpha-L-rhamnosidase
MALPLYLGIAPNPQRVILTLLNDISNHQNHLTTGIVGTKYLLLLLSDIGRTDLALELVSGVLLFYMNLMSKLLYHMHLE